MLLFVFTISIMLVGNNISKIQKQTANAEMDKRCCLFSNNFKYNGKQEFGGIFTINFGLAVLLTNKGDNPLFLLKLSQLKIQFIESTIKINQSSERENSFKEKDNDKNCKFTKIWS